MNTCKLFVKDVKGTFFPMEIGGFIYLKIYKEEEEKFKMFSF